jgi:hypothetical protein
MVKAKEKIGEMGIIISTQNEDFIQSMAPTRIEILIAFIII